MTLERIAVRVATEDVEIARATLLEVAPAGFEEVHAADTVTLVVYGDATVCADVLAAFPDATTQPVEPGWEDAWRTFHQPVVTGGIWVGPPWCEPPIGTPAVVIDPGRAFGTGAHPTTQLCIELLAGLGRGSLLDIGSGSGVIAIAGSRLGFAPVVAIDDDPVAVAVSRANARANGVEVDVVQCDAAAAPLPVCDIAVANVTLEVVTTVLGSVPARVVVTSGYLAHQRPLVDGWTSIERRETRGWAADVHIRDRPGV